MSRLITTETPEQARARINRQLIAQGGVPHCQAGLNEVERAIANVARALDDAKNALARCKALGVIN